MSKIENLQKIFTKKIPEVKNLDYWQRLKFLKMLSQERRMERYRALYVWKILECVTPNFGLETMTSERRGREVVIKPARWKQSIQTLRENSFQVNGAKVFNSLPKKIRNLTKEFK